MPQTVDAVQLRLEGLERVQKVRYAEVVRDPAFEVGGGGGEVVGVVRKHLVKTQEIRRDLTDESTRIRVIVGVLDAAVLRLQSAECRDRPLEVEPGGRRGDVRFETAAGGLLSPTFDDLGLPDDRGARCARDVWHGSTSDPQESNARKVLFIRGYLAIHGVWLLPARECCVNHRSPRTICEPTLRVCGA